MEYFLGLKRKWSTLVLGKWNQDNWFERGGRNFWVQTKLGTFWVQGTWCSSELQTCFGRLRPEYPFSYSADHSLFSFSLLRSGSSKTNLNSSLCESRSNYGRFSDALPDIHVQYPGVFAFENFCRESVFGFPWGSSHVLERGPHGRWVWGNSRAMWGLGFGRAWWVMVNGW